jgi:hypothetical protein
VRPGVVVSEAWRNLITGTSRAAVFSTCLALVVGLLCAADARAIASLLDSAAEFRSAGGATFLLTAPKGVSGKACEDLGRMDGISGAGAIRADTEVAPRALPRVRLPAWEATPGFGRVLGTDVTGGLGILVSQQAADQLRVVAGERLATNKGAVQVAAVFSYPDDGRLPDLMYSVISPVPAVGVFDACWARLWPSNLTTAALLRTTLTGPGGANVSVTQLNSRLGADFDGQAKFDRRPTRDAGAGALLASLVLGFSSVRIRRLELSSALHCGVGPSAIRSMVAAEALVWAVTAACLCVPFIAAACGVAGDRTLAEAEDILVIQLRAVLAAVAGCVIGAVGAATLVRERHLFRYFKDR